jgi:hypothetical protein
MKFPRQCPLVLAVNVGWYQDKTLGKESTTMESGLMDCAAQ